MTVQWDRRACAAAATIRRAAMEALEARTLLHAGHVHVADGTVAAAIRPNSTTVTIASQPSLSLSSSSSSSSSSWPLSVPFIGPLPLADTGEASASTLLSVSAVTPKNGSVNVPVATDVTVTFAGPVDPTSVTTDTIELRDAAGALISAVVTFDETSGVAVLDPAADLPSSNGAVYARVKGGPGGVKDPVGNWLASDLNWSFSTGKPQFTLTTLFNQLNQPTVVKFAPDGRVFVAEKSGLVRMYDSLQDDHFETVIDLRAKVHNFWDRGLLGMALDPNFATNNYVYLLYTYDGDIGQNNAPKYGTLTSVSDPGPDATGNGAIVSGRLTRVTLGASGHMIPGSELVLVHDWAQQFPSHSIGTIAFGPDGALYASAGDGASFNYADYGQTGNPFNDPVNEGGALRSQDLTTSGDPTGLDGTIIRINAADGSPMSSSPIGADPNAQRIIAQGLRNPFRFTFRPGTSEIWVGDVGMDTWEEINRINAADDSAVENFGWPAYEGVGRQPGYDALDLPLLENLYAAGPSAVTAPFFTYKHSEKLEPGSAEPTGGSSTSGLAFYEEDGSYPAAFHNALFFSDYARRTTYVMFAGPDGVPDPSTRQVFRLGVGAVDLTVGPNGDIFFADLAGFVGRYQYNGGPVNRAPSAAVTANPTVGLLPLTVHFSAAASTDPDEGDVLTYAWDLDGDGQFDDSTDVAPTHTFTTIGNHVVTVRVTDQSGASDLERVTISADNSAPQPVIDNPIASLHWKVGDTIPFSATAIDAEDGALPASALRWELILLHDNLIDPSNSHQHEVQEFEGVASGEFVAPDHEYPSRLMLRLTATDSQNVSATTSVILMPQTSTLRFESSPGGLVIGVGTQSVVTPADVTTIAGSSTSVTAPTPQTSGATSYGFMHWSDGGTRSHNFAAPAGGGTWTATFGTTYVWPAVVASGDTYVQDGSGAAKNFGAEPQLITKKSNPGFNREGLVKFDLSSVTGNLESVKVRLFGYLQDTRESSVDVDVYATATTWTETGVTWNTLPAPIGTKLGSVVLTSTVGAYHEVDVTAYAQAERAAGRNQVAFLLRNPSTSQPFTRFNSRESPANRPVLAITALSAEPPPPANLPPAVNAGVDASVVLPATLALDATVTDDGLPAGNAITSRWSMASGPAAVTFGDSSLIDTSVAFSAAGTYVLRLRASDGMLSGVDDLTVIVSDPLPPPTTPQTYIAIADAYVQDGDSAGTNFGGATGLLVKKSPNAGFSRESLVKFDLTSFTGTAESVKLRLWGSLQDTRETNLTTDVYDTTTTTWAESAVTWNTRPAVGAHRGSVVVADTAAAYHEIDLTSFVQAELAADRNVVSLLLRNPSNSGPFSAFGSRESTNTPQLVVTPTSVPNPNPTTTLTASADAYVQDGASADADFGAAQTLFVKKSPNAGFNREAVFLFDLASFTGPVTSATLRLFGFLQDDREANLAVDVYGATTTWTESAVTWNTRPDRTPGVKLGSIVVANSTGRYYDLDLTAYIQSAKSAGATSVAFLVSSPLNTGPAINFTSREAAANRPHLVLR